MQLDFIFFPSPVVVASAQTYSSSFVQYTLIRSAPLHALNMKGWPNHIRKYGLGNSRSSSNCNTATTACGFFNYPDDNQAVFQNLYGVGIKSR